MSPPIPYASAYPVPPMTMSSPGPPHRSSLPPYAGSVVHISFTTLDPSGLVKASGSMRTTTPLSPSMVSAELSHPPYMVSSPVPPIKISGPRELIGWLPPPTSMSSLPP